MNLYIGCILVGTIFACSILFAIFSAWSPILSRVLAIFMDTIIFLKSSANGCLFVNVFVEYSLIFVNSL